MSTTQLLPHSTDAERSVIGCMLLDADIVHDIVAKIQPADFYDPIHRTIYTAICQLYADASPIDFVTVAEKLKGESGIQSIGGSAFLAELPQEVPTSTNAGQYANIIKAQSIKRQMATLGQEISGMASDVTGRFKEGQLWALQTGPFLFETE